MNKRDETSTLIYDYGDGIEYRIPHKCPYSDLINQATENPKHRAMNYNDLTDDQ